MFSLGRTGGGYDTHCSEHVFRLSLFGTDDVDFCRTTVLWIRHRNSLVRGHWYIFDGIRLSVLMGAVLDDEIHQERAFHFISFFYEKKYEVELGVFQEHFACFSFGAKYRAAIHSPICLLFCNRRVCWITSAK